MRKKVIKTPLKPHKPSKPRSTKPRQSKKWLVVSCACAGVFVFLLLFTPVEVTKEFPEETFTTTVDPVQKVILGEYEARTYKQKISIGTLLLSSIRNYAPFISLSSPGMTYIHLNEGLRKEQVAEQVGKKLHWKQSDKEMFLSDDETYPEGTFHPGDYIVPSKELPALMKENMRARFETEVKSKYPQATEEKVPLADALIIASIIEREAASKQDMRLISGVIWNRLWNGMTLDIDATLQYAKGTANNKWWPRVLPKDKAIASPYNTYKEEGLPPAPISNPGVATIRAALNPEKTNCLYYLHDKQKDIHCSETYEGHLKNIKLYYGK